MFRIIVALVISATSLLAGEKEDILNKIVGPTVRINVDDAGEDGIGTGVIVKKEQLLGSSFDYGILTCWHVIDSFITELDIKDTSGKTKRVIIASAVPISTYHFDGKNLVRDKTVWASITLFNKQLDMAMLSLITDRILPVAEIADPTNASYLDKVYVAGCPLGADITVVEGRIQKLNEEVGPNKLYRTSCPIMFGNSGGGLWTEDGKLLGIMELIALDSMGNPVEHIGLAIPVYVVKEWITPGKIK